MTTEQRQETANTILAQLGGQKFIAMTGAKNLSFGSKGELMFSIGRNGSKANNVCIGYDHGQDLYYMVFGRVTMKAGYKVLQNFEGIYCDQLQELFTDYTGMATRL